MQLVNVSDLDPSRLLVMPLGIGNAFTRTHYHTSLVLFAEGQAILIDCPAPLRRIFWEAEKTCGVGMDIKDFDHVVVTHLHGDHCNGLEEYAFFRRFALPGGKKPNLYLLPELTGPAWENRLKAAMGRITPPDSNVEEAQTLTDYFRVHEWEEGKRCHLDAVGSRLEFRIRRTQHFIPCFGFKVSYNGLTLGYSADTGWDPEHIEFLKDSDLIIHECGRGLGHTPYEHLAGLPEKIRKKMLLIHINDDFQETGIPVMKEGAIYDVAKGVKAVKRDTVCVK